MAQNYTVTSKTVSPLLTQTINAPDHERAVAAAIAAQAATGGAGAGCEYSVPSCTSIPPGPTGWSANTQFTSPLTGSTYSGNSPEDAKNQHKAAKGPTGPGGNLQIFQTF